MKNSNSRDWYEKNIYFCFFIAGFFTLIAMMWRDYRRTQETPRGALNRLTYEKNEAKKQYLEGPNYPYQRREVNRPYFKTD